MPNLTRSTGNTGGLIKDVAALASISSKNDRELKLYDGSRYITSAIDGGAGIQLASLNYANPVGDSAPDPQTAINTGNISTNTGNISTKQNKEFDPIGTVTALEVGGKYCSTVTNTHTLADGVNAGKDSIIFSWLRGTIGTITGASAIVFTDKDNTLHSDNTWVFDFPIVNVVLVWNGLNWEIQ